jgi:hypothetical protein
MDSVLTADWMGLISWIRQFQICLAFIAPVCKSKKGDYNLPFRIDSLEQVALSSKEAKPRSINE